ncbi:hypothetical protein L537_3377 [Bordetella hinzii 1277]|uniref:hypothetical protein n=1 Tax=Bordetella hinzii TaxID=103855 RepID=UPI00045B99A3|nr:hypothetical protein [Bordetella hinzii]KCB52753.1 hypothetical protein L537_3377 [Bordetella hinzii 1277]
MTHPHLAAKQADIALDPLAGTLVRAHVSPDADPWARGGHETATYASPSRANAGSGAATEAGVNVNILALDLGTKTGFALRRSDGRVAHGTEVFTPRASWTPGQKWQRFRVWLSRTIVDFHISTVAFEDVKAHGKGAVLAAHAYGGFRAMMEMVADQHNVRLVPVGVGVVKKHWTGKGNADKAAMLAQARARGFRPETDNDADALAILDWAVAQERAA